MPGIAQHLERLLREFQEMLPDVEAIVVINDQGLTLASAVPLGADEEQIAAMATVGFSLGERAIAELERGDWEHAILKGSDGVIIIHSLGDEGGAIAALASKDAKIGMILYMMRRLAKEIVEVLKKEGIEGSQSGYGESKGRESTDKGLDFGIPPIG